MSSDRTSSPKKLAGVPPPHPNFGDDDGSCICGCSFFEDCVRWHTSWCDGGECPYCKFIHNYHLCIICNYVFFAILLYVFIIVLYYLIIIYLYQQALFSCKFGTVLTIFVSVCVCVCVCVCAYNTCSSFLALLINDTRNDDIVEHSYYGDKNESYPCRCSFCEECIHGHAKWCLVTHCTYCAFTSL